MHLLWVKVDILCCAPEAHNVLFVCQIRQGRDVTNETLELKEHGRQGHSFQVSKP